MQLAVEDPGANSSNCGEGYSCTYTNTISWSSPTTPRPMEVNPRTLFERLFGDRAGNPANAGRVPPGQYVTEKFPVLHYGSVPKVDLATWDFRVFGEVDSPLTFTWDQFQALPRAGMTADIHCVTRWSKLDTNWEGVSIKTILEMAQVRPSATHVVGHAEQGYTANLPLDVNVQFMAIMATKMPFIGRG